jgi:N-acetylmuramoyl-L-alanine amidase
MAKVYLSPALHAVDNPCSNGKGCTENTHCAQYMDLLIPYLDACGIQWKRSDKKNTGAGYAKTIAESNAFAPDIHFVKHTNACAAHNAVGSRIFVWPNGKGKQIGELMLKHRKPFYPNGGKVVENTTLTEIRNTKAVGIYDEMVFHDNPKDVKYLHERMQEFAKADAKALCEYFGIPFKDPYENKQTVNVGIYAVQVGAFSKKENADKLAEELKKKGYSVYIVKK